MMLKQEERHRDEQSSLQWYEFHFVIQRTSRVSAVNSGRRYLPDNRFMKPVLQNPSIAKQTCILFSCSLTRSFHIS